MHICYVYIYIYTYVHRFQAEGWNLFSSHEHVGMAQTFTPKKKHQMRCITTCIDNSILQTKKSSPKSMTPPVWWNFRQKPQQIDQICGYRFKYPHYIRPPFLLPWPYMVCYKSAANLTGSWYEKLTGRYIEHAWSCWTSEEPLGFMVDISN